MLVRTATEIQTVAKADEIVVHLLIQTAARKDMHFFAVSLYALLLHALHALHANKDVGRCGTLLISALTAMHARLVSPYIVCATPQ